MDQYLSTSDVIALIVIASVVAVTVIINTKMCPECKHLSLVKDTRRYQEQAYGETIVDTIVFCHHCAGIKSQHAYKEENEQ